MKPLVGTGLATCCSILSFFGIIFLTGLGWAFKVNAEVLMGSSKESPLDGQAVASVCFTAAFIYTGLLGFCGCQALVGRRYNSQIRL